MDQPKRMKVIKNILLGDIIILIGQKVDVLKINNKFYKVFHSLYWWKVLIDYFEDTYGTV